jgi:hypothetical protein
MTAPALLLGRLARRYRLERAMSRLLAGAAGGVSLAGLVHYAGGGARGVITALVTGLAGGALAAWAGELRRPVDHGTVARHLDRALPELEESASLLVESPAPEGALAALQRARVERRFDPDRARRPPPGGRQQYQAGPGPEPPGRRPAARSRGLAPSVRDSTR